LQSGGCVYRNVLCIVSVGTCWKAARTQRDNIGWCDAC